MSELNLKFKTIKTKSAIKKRLPDYEGDLPSSLLVAKCPKNVGMTITQKGSGYELMMFSTSNTK